MELGEVGAERRILESGEDAVPDVLVEWHATLACGSPDHDAGAEHRFGLTSDERRQDVGQRLRRILTVAVEHDDDVEAVLDRHLVAGLLVAAIAEIGRLPDERDRQIGDLLVTQSDEVGRVLTVIVADDHLFDVTPDLVGDAVEHLCERCRGVVRDNQDPDALSLNGPHAYPLESATTVCRTLGTGPITVSSAAVTEPSSLLQDGLV